MEPCAGQTQPGKYDGNISIIIVVRTDQFLATASRTKLIPSIGIPYCSGLPVVTFEPGVPQAHLLRNGSKLIIISAGHTAPPKYWADRKTKNEGSERNSLLFLRGGQPKQNYIQCLSGPKLLAAEIHFG